MQPCVLQLQSRTFWEVVAFASIVSSSIYYTCIWYSPESYKRAVRPQDPCQVRFSRALLIECVHIVFVWHVCAWLQLHITHTHCDAGAVFTLTLTPTPLSPPLPRVCVFVQHMAFWANVLKVIQFTALFFCTSWETAFKMPLWQWAVALTLIAAGQHLNFLVYHLLGVDGVYYGSRFGKKLAWVTAYPYNTMRDPQYIGSMITLFGGAFIAPAEIILWWFANYCYLMWLESKVPDILTAGQ